MDSNDLARYLPIIYLAVVTMVAHILPMVALFQVFDGLGAITAGILRAEGKQFTGALLNLRYVSVPASPATSTLTLGSSAYYVVGIPFGIWLAFSHHFGLYGLWIGLTVALVYSATAGVWICLRTDWEHQVDKVRRRLEEEHKAGVQHDTEAVSGAH
jgi:multidrug resistance protein, MATE family